MKCSEIISLIFSGVVAISTIVYVYLTHKLVKESKASREFQQAPYIISSIAFSEMNKKIILLTIRNIGLGYAKNVTFNIMHDFELIDNFPFKERGAFKNGIRSFPPNYELTFIAAVFKENERKPISDNDFIEFEVNYKDKNDKKYSDHYKHAFNEIISKGYSNTPLDIEESKVYYLKLIEEQLKRINEK